LPDLIFLDLNLPRKDGRELLADIKADVTVVYIFQTPFFPGGVMHEIDLAMGGMLNLLIGSAVAGILPLLPDAMRSAYHLKAHIHFLTLGFFTFMIYGLGYHMLPLRGSSASPSG